MYSASPLPPLWTCMAETPALSGRPSDGMGRPPPAVMTRCQFRLLATQRVLELVGMGHSDAGSLQTWTPVVRLLTPM